MFLTSDVQVFPHFLNILNECLIVTHRSCTVYFMLCINWPRCYRRSTSTPTLPRSRTSWRSPCPLRVRYVISPRALWNPLRPRRRRNGCRLSPLMALQTNLRPRPTMRRFNTRSVHGCWCGSSLLIVWLTLQLLFSSFNKLNLNISMMSLASL